MCQIATCFLPLQDYMRVAQVYNQYRITELLLHGVDPSLLLSECAKPSWTLFPNNRSLSLSLSLISRAFALSLRIGNCGIYSVSINLHLFCINQPPLLPHHPSSFIYCVSKPALTSSPPPPPPDIHSLFVNKPSSSSSWVLLVHCVSFE